MIQYAATLLLVTVAAQNDRPAGFDHLARGTQVVPESVTVVPGSPYGRAGIVSAFMGKGYRDLWTIPITVEVADLAALGGGLTPLRLGGGATTQTLHVRGADGRRYVLRSVDKFVGQGLPEEFQGTIYEFILQDQISAFHPSGALVVAALLDAADILHVEPKLFVVPDDPGLGEFREMFAGKLVLFEERPDEGPDDTPGFAGSTRVVGTDRLIEQLEEDPRHRLDSRAFLRVRLVDLLVGDRDRSVNNWWWASFEEEGTTVWRPIPRDRDQAFIRLDGLLKWYLRFFEPRLVAFDDDFPSIVGLTRSAWDMDRPFLVGLPKQVWDSVVVDLQTRMTDSVIAAAVRRMPPEHTTLIGDLLAERLAFRRNRLQQAANRFYRIVNEYAEIHTTDAPELAVVDRLSEAVEVQVYLHDSSGARASVPHFTRRFHGDETKEIRLYLHGGRDRAVVRGTGAAIKVRLVGGGGLDELIDSSGTAAGTNAFYDGGSSTVFSTSHNTVVVRRNVPRPQSWGATSAHAPDWGGRWQPIPRAPFTPDLGLFVFAGLSYKGYGFLKEPYSWMMEIGGGIGTRRGKIEVDFKYRRLDVAPHTDFTLRTKWSSTRTINFFGFGNETTAAGPSSFFHVDQGQFQLTPVITRSLGRHVRLELGPIFRGSSTDTMPETATLLSQTQPYGSGRFNQLGARSLIRLDLRNRQVAASRGIMIEAAGEYYPEMLDLERGAFGSLEGHAATYLSFSGSDNQTLALRVGGEKVWGRFPFYEAAFLGGSKTLRGFSRQRFAGDASLYGSAEFRVFLTRVTLLFPSEFGVVAVTDAGRVFQNGESSDKWHVSGGGGLWLAPVDREYTVSGTLVRSAEGTKFYVGTGFGF